MKALVFGMVLCATALREGRLSKDEARKRVEVKQY